MLESYAIFAKASASKSSCNNKTTCHWSKCHPGNSKVLVKVNGKVQNIQMNELKVGDKVWNGSNYEPVIGFTNLEPDVTTQYFRIETRNGKSIQISNGHYLLSSNNKALMFEPLIPNSVGNMASIVLFP